MKECIICGQLNEKTICKSCYEEGKKFWEERKDNGNYYNWKKMYNYWANDIPNPGLFFGLFEKGEDKKAYFDRLNEAKTKMLSYALGLYFDKNDKYLLNKIEEDIIKLTESYIEELENYEEEYDDEDYDDEEYDDEDYDDEIETQCVICGNEANGYWFCPDCYREYKNKEVTVRFTRCTETEVLDATYESVYVCDDGHRVKSKSEQAIDNWLYANKIWHVYEKEFQYGNDFEEIIHPDFYLPDYDLYIEHWGFTDDNYYQQQMENKLKIYKKEKVTLICLYEKTDGKNINRALEYKLKHYKKGQINFEE